MKIFFYPKCFFVVVITTISVKIFCSNGRRRSNYRNNYSAAIKICAEVVSCFQLLMSIIFGLQLKSL